MLICNCYLNNREQVSPELKIDHFLLPLLLCGNVASNPGLTNFGFGYCRSIHNQEPLIHDPIKYSDLDILGVAETLIRASDIDGLSCTPLYYQFIHNPLKIIGQDDGVVSCVGILPLLILLPRLISEHLKASYCLSCLTTGHFVAACLYHPLGPCNTVS